MLSSRFAIVVCISCFLTQPANAVSYFLRGVAKQLNSTSGESTYTFGLNLSEWLDYHDNISLELVSPNGVHYPETTTVYNGVNVYIKGILPADVNSVASGIWTVEETIDGTQLNQYQFSVPPILDSSNFRPTPVITSPMDGATVKPVFDVTWTNPEPSGLAYSISYAGDKQFPLGYPHITHSAPGEATFSYLGVSGFSGAEVSSFSIVTKQTLTNKLLPVTSLNSSGNSTFTGGGSVFAGSLTYETYSPPISFTVVPETTTEMYLLMAGLMALCFARRK